MKAKILLVDDEPHNLVILKIYLSSLGYDLYEVNCGEEALNMVDTVRPDLILLDVMLPDITGFEVCRILHEKDGFSTPIILLSANIQPEAVKHGLNSGAVAYMNKPFEFDLLEQEMAKALKNKGEYK
jgi:two-component system, cell cycle response regulator